MISRAVCLFWITAFLIASYGHSTLADPEYKNWEAIYQVAKSEANDRRFNSNLYNTFNSKHPTGVFRNLSFDQFTDLCDDNHNGLIDAKVLSICYFTLLLANFEYVINNYADSRGIISKEKYALLHSAYNFLETFQYERVAQVMTNPTTKTKYLELNKTRLLKKYYKLMPLHLERLLFSYAKSKNGFISQSEFDSMDSKFKIYKDSFQVVTNYLNLTNGKLTIKEAVKYFCIKKPSHMWGCFADGSEFVEDVSKEAFDYINNRYKIFSESYEEIKREADVSADGIISVDEIVSHYFTSSRTLMQRAVKVLMKNDAFFSSDHFSELQAQFPVFQSMSYKEAMFVADFQGDHKLSPADVVAYYFTGSPRRLKIFFQDFDTNKNGTINQQEYQKMEGEYKLFKKSFNDLKRETNTTGNALKLDDIIPYYFTKSIRQMLRAVKSFNKDFIERFSESEFNELKNEMKLFNGQSFKQVKGSRQYLGSADIVTMFFQQDDVRIKSAIESFDEDRDGKLDLQNIYEMISVFKIFKDVNEAKPTNFNNKPILIADLVNHYKQLAKSSGSKK